MPYSYEAIQPFVDELAPDVADVLKSGELPNVKERKNVMPPKDEKDDADVSQYVTDLWRDYQEFWISYFQRTSHMRPKVPGGKVFNVEDWLKAAESLSYGRDFEVWGKRAEDWMQERIDAEIPRAMRVRRDHITANWHEIEVQPNVQGIGDIFEQERKKIGWKDWIEEFVLVAQTYGYAVNEIVMDYSLHDQGQVKNVVLMPWEIGRTPGSLSFAKADGCHCAVVYKTLTDHQIAADFPNLDLSSLQTVEDMNEEKYDRRPDRQYGDYKTVNFYPQVTAYCDDDELELIPFTDENNAQMIDELKDMLDGKEVKAQEGQHHIEHIRNKWEALQNLLSVPPANEDEMLLSNHIASVHMDNIRQHIELATNSDLAARGMRQKYPHGRYVVTIGGKVVHDEPNPFGIPWRMKFRELKNQRVVNRIDSAGDPELMFNEQFYIDMQLSRIEDLSLLGIPQVWRHVNDKNIKGEDVNDNNPRRQRFYATTPPHTEKADPPVAQIELYKIAKSNIEKDRGVNEVAYGKRPPSGTPAKQTELIKRQNMVVVTGELDRNLREVLEDIVEGMFEVMKVFYTQPRKYLIKGEYKELTVSNILKVYTITDPVTKEQREEELPKIQVTVKPASNYPNQWEQRLAFFLEMSSYKDEDGQPIIPSQAILDHIAIEYPEFGEGGKYRRISDATKIGLILLAQREAEIKARAKQQNPIANAGKKFEKQELTPQPGKESGNGQGTK